jgi:hypothetical protein
MSFELILSYRIMWIIIEYELELITMWDII